MNVYNRRWMFVLFSALCIIAPASAQQTVTLYSPHDKKSDLYDESRSWVSFDVGGRNDLQKTILTENGDLGYGFLAINGEDFFTVNHGERDRSVIKDLGTHEWTDGFGLPALGPLPELAEGERRLITVDATADTGADWQKSTRVFAKAVIGHIYVVHIKKGDTDLYGLFRVEEIKQAESCTISWVKVALPG